MKPFLRFLVYAPWISTLIGGILGGCLHFNAHPNQYIPGIYEGLGEGYQGPIQVMVQVSTGNILDIEIIEHKEDEAIGGLAIAELLEAVLDSNSTDLDAVSGATESSFGFLAALEDALKKALK